MNKLQQLCGTALISASLLTACGGGSTSDSTDNDSDNQPPVSSEPSSSALVINEIVANATDGGHDWIELYALEDGIALAEFSLVDDNSERTPQVLPDLTLAMGEFVVIQAIDEEDTPPEDGLYVTFKLGSDDAVILIKDEQTIHTLDWEEGDAVEGTSYGLYADGTGTAQTLSPTPGVANQQTKTEVVYDLIINESAPIRINEVVAKDSADGHDWIELFVTGSQAVNLSNYQIADQNNELIPLLLCQLSRVSIIVFMQHQRA